uniref:CW-type domain-containing protein n=1 Tax=Caenorhabditis tropicalis TaxID=1561998 RepID=A0A1I7USR6_9PELO
MTTTVETPPTDPSPSSTLKKEDPLKEVQPLKKKRKKRKKKENWRIDWMCLTCWNEREDGKCSCETLKPDIYEEFPGFFLMDSGYNKKTYPMDETDRFILEYKRRYG